MHDQNFQPNEETNWVFDLPVCFASNSGNAKLYILKIYIWEVFAYQKREVLCILIKHFYASKVSLFCLAIGQDPKELPVGIVNGELPGGVACTNGKNMCILCLITKQLFTDFKLEVINILII